MDKLEKLYNIYLKEGIISNATSFEKWKAADSIKQEKLFEIGKSKGLFKTSTVDKFKAAWGEAAIPTVKKKRRRYGITFGRWFFGFVRD